MQRVIYGTFQTQRALHVVSLTYSGVFGKRTRVFIEESLQKYADDLAIEAASLAAPLTWGKERPPNKEVTLEMLMQAQRSEGSKMISEREVLERHDRELGLGGSLVAAIVTTLNR